MFIITCVKEIDGYICLHLKKLLLVSIPLLYTII